MSSIIIIRCLKILTFAATFMCVAEFDGLLAGSVNFRGEEPIEQMEDENGNPISAAVIVRQPIFVTDPDSIDSEDIEPAPKFLEVVPIFRATSDDLYYLVQSQGIWGWMERSELLLRPRSLRAAELEYETDCRGGYQLQAQQPNPGDDPSLVKIVVKNNWKRNKGRITAASYFDKPGKQDQHEIGKSNVFKIQYAYKLCQGDDRETYIFVGDEPIYDPDYPNLVLKGWIRKSDVVLWTKMTAVYYDKGNLKERKPVQIFGNEADLRHYMATGSTDNARGAENSADFRELKYYENRFPIVRDKGDVLKIVWIGGARDAEGKTVLTKEEVGARREAVQKIVSDVGNRDILFLIDATTSMGKYFNIVIEALDEFIKHQKLFESRRFRYAAAIYRDYNNEAGPFEVISDFRSANVARQLDSSLASNAAGNTDFPEAMYQGIVRSVASVTWRPNSTRTIIVIGDHSNHEPDPEGYTIDSVVEALEKERVLFYAINVSPEGNEHQDLNRRFQQQVRAILEKNSSLGGSTYTAPDEFDRDEEMALENIVSSLENAFEISRDTQTATRDLIEGHSVAEIDAKFGTIVTTYMLNLMKEAGLTPKEASLASLKQFAIEGWVEKDHREINNFKPWVLISRAKLDELVGFLARLNTDLIRRASGKGLGNAITQSAKAATGDDIMEGERLSDFLARVFHIPFKENSRILGNTGAELENKFRVDKRFRLEMKRLLCEKYKKLHFVIESKLGTVNWENGKCRAEPSGAKKWWWTSISGDKYAWIPMNYLP